MPDSQTITIAIVNEKGGCGKSTTSVNLAAGLALSGHPTCLVDLDQQCNTTLTFAIDPDELPKEGRFSALDIFLGKKRAIDIEIPFPDRFDGRLALIPGSRGLGSVHHRLEATMQADLMEKSNSIIVADELRDEHRQRLKRSLGSLRGQRNFVILDTPGDLGFQVTTALIAADYYLIPVFPSGYDLQGLDALTASIAKVREKLNPDLQFLGVLFGRVDGRTRLDSDIKANLQEHLGREHVLESTISNSVRVREAPLHNETIFEYDPNDRTAAQFKSLTQELLAKLGERAPEPVVTLQPQGTVEQPAPATEAGQGSQPSLEGQPREVGNA